MAAKRVRGTKGYSNVHRPTSHKDTTAFIEKAISYLSNDCLMWPFGTAVGYGCVSRRYVHVLVCEAVYGPKPSGRHEVAHRCGIRLCVNPRHLRWATRKENVADCINHGTYWYGERHGQAKLTIKRVRHIRDKLNCGSRELAIRFGVSQATINNVRSRRTWAWLE